MQDPGWVAISLIVSLLGLIQPSYAQGLFPLPSKSPSPTPVTPLSDLDAYIWRNSVDPEATNPADPSYEQVPIEELTQEEAYPAIPSDEDSDTVLQLDLQQVQAPEKSQGSQSGYGSNSAAGSSTGSGNGSDSNYGLGSGHGAGSGNGVGTGSAPGVGSGSGLSHGSGSRPTGDSNDTLKAASQRHPQTTGLIVDARGLDFEPSMSMRIFDPDGNQIYTPPQVNQSLNAYRVASEGTAAYATTEAQARSLVQRVGSHPHTIKATRTLGYDLVISGEDAWDLSQRNQLDRFLETYSVVVIWDPNQARLP